MNVVSPAAHDPLERRLLPGANPDTADRRCAWDELLAAGTHDQLTRYVGRRNYTSVPDEDIVQDVLRLAYTKMEQGKYQPGPVGIIGWLVRIAHYKIKEAAREHAHPSLDDFEEVLPDPRAWLRSMESLHSRAVLARALEALPERRRMIVMLSVFNDFSSDEIAQRLNIRADLVRKDKSLALQQLRRILAPELPDSSIRAA
jgi:RNA polymerase sigma factor (sigma-70 family)